MLVIHITSFNPLTEHYLIIHETDFTYEKDYKLLTGCPAVTLFV